MNYKTTHVAPLALVATLLAAGIMPGRAADPDYDSIADSLVNQSLQVQPGEIVSINGGPTEVALMEALVVAVSKAGGQPVVLLNLPNANKRAIMETPMEHLGQLPTAQVHLSTMADCVINVASIQDPDLFADVPEERLTAARKAAAPLNTLFRNARFRSVALGQTGGIPTEAFAASENADFQQMNALFWRSLEVPPARLAATGHKISGMLKPGSKVHLTTATGTDLTFDLGKLPARINAGRTADVIQATGPAQVWLPAGEAYACVEGTSASGTLAVPHFTFRGVPVRNLRLTFEDGRVTGMSADEHGEMLKEFLDASSENSKNLSIIDIGLNSESKPLPGSSYYSWEMGGMVTVAMGNNSWAGGDNDADGGLSIYVAGATLTVDGNKIVADGNLEGSLLKK
jgi:leucyl aminopeptidase (aminopeptidase T)